AAWPVGGIRRDSAERIETAARDATERCCRTQRRCCRRSLASKTDGSLSHQHGETDQFGGAKYAQQDDLKDATDAAVHNESEGRSRRASRDGQPYRGHDVR
ncbi:hypothetical protein, partial [Nonomuraea sp. NPDC049784]|uniref:hypothetical protein n=1 Tax=Nonomuraea sp. NPDC049784 TaxID=3154361 RepID=UPI0033E79B64